METGLQGSYGILASTASEGGGVWSIVAESSGVVLLVLIALVLASMSSWLLIGYKGWALYRARKQSEAFLDRFWATRNLDEVGVAAVEMADSPIAAVFTSGYSELRKVVNAEGKTTSYGLENVERAMRRSGATQTTHLERFLPFLATVGSTSPFVGLFGTVWGIMLAFTEIAQLQQAGIDVVAGPIAEALIATATGLVAAIPAVMAYNLFSNTVENLQVETESFMADFLNLIRRNFVE